MHKVVTTLPKVDAIINRQTLKFADPKIARVYFRTTANFHFETKLPARVELLHGKKVLEVFDKLAE